MASPREPELGILAPLAPNFPRLISSGDKYPGVDAAYNDIVRQPATDPVLRGKVDLVMDVPVTVRRATARFTDASFIITPANHFGSIKIFDMPDRNILLMGAELNVTLGWAGDFANLDDIGYGVGTSPASTNPIATTQQNVITRVALANINPAAVNAVTQTFRTYSSGVPVADMIVITDAPGLALYFNVDVVAAQLAADGIVRVLDGNFDLWYLDLGNIGS